MKIVLPAINGSQLLNIASAILGVILAGGEALLPDYIPPLWKHYVLQTAALDIAIIGAVNVWLHKE